MVYSPSKNDRDKDSLIEYPALSGETARRVNVVNTLGDPVPVIFASGSATALTIANVSVPLANTEVSYLIPASTKKIQIKARGRSKIQYAFVLGDSSLNYITIWPGFSQEIEDILLSSSTIYFQTSLASETVEVLTWS